MSVASQHDVMIAKVALPEQRGNFLLSSIKQESCDTVSVTPASTDNLPITTTTTISELVRSTNQVQSESTFYITPPPYFPTAEHLTIPGPHPPTWSTLNQKQVSEACSRPLRLHSVPTLLNPSPIINNVTTITPVLVSGVIPSCLPQQNQSLSNPIRLRNPPINAFVNNHLRLPSSENTTALYPGVFLGGSITPPIIQSFGSNIPNVLNGTPAYHPLLHNNHSSAQRALSASSTRAVQSSTYLPLNVPIQPQQLMNNTRYCSTVSSTNDLNRVISNSFNVNDSINRSNNNDNDINSLTIVHCHLGNSCINHPSLNKDCNPVEQVCSSLEPHQKSLNQSIRRSNSLEPVNINQIIATKTVALPTHSSEISVSAIDKQTFTTAVSFHSSATIATTIAPDIVTATSNYDSSMENSTFDGVLWGRLCRRADGDLMFPGLSQTCTFRGANSMLKQIFQMIRTTEDSLSLQLPASALRNEIDSDLRLENHPSASLLNPVSKKKNNSSVVHAYLVNKLRMTKNTFLISPPKSNVIPQATTNQSDMNLVPSTTNSVGTIRRNPIDKRNISITNNILPGGIIKATNHCAIFNHFTSTHPNQMNLWTLKPSLLTIYPLTKSLTCSDSTKSSLSDLLSNTPSGKSFTSLVPNRSDEFESDSEFFNDLCSSAVFSDLRQSLNNISAFDNFDLLHSSSSSFKSVDNVVDDDALSNSSINLDDYHNNVIIEEFSSLQRIFTPSPNSSHRQQIISNDKGATDHHRQHHHQLYPHLPRLPSPDRLCDICLPPSAPSNTYLNQALGYLQISSNHNNHDHHNLTSVSYTTKTNPTSDALSIDNGKRKSKNLNENRQSGVLCCLICKYRTNDPKLLVDHLIGDPPLIQTKCGLCGQVLYINEPLLCSVKAHLLLHLGCFLMCPRCGFTPPLYLAPDCAQLCLRVHLRFVCYHFNLKEVYQCKYCEGHANDSGDSSLHNKNQSIFRSTSIQEISHHLKSFHWPFVSSPSPVIEQVNNNEITEQQPMCSMTETVMTVNAVSTPLPSLPTVTVNHKPMSTISDGRDDSTALSKLNSNFNNLCTNSDVSQTTKSQNNPLPPHHPHNRKRNMKSILSFNLVPHVDYSIAFQCIECLKEINTKGKLR
ncbi:zinc C2H2 type [Schistosoma japonicum]|nr:zinc C2H2 type [Schistosoma japonicum]